MCRRTQDKVLAYLQGTVTPVECKLSLSGDLFTKPYITNLKNFNIQGDNHYNDNFLINSYFRSYVIM